MEKSGPEFQRGQRFGPYVLVEELGRGTFGVVWLAERRAKLATTQFALKFPLGSDVDVEAVRKEAELWVRASGHPNILPVIEADIYDEQIVIVSEYAAEGTLRHWLRRRGGSAPTVDAAVAMGVGILAGLGHLHSRKLLHRDLKPANILLQGELPRIADFGLARVLRSVASTHGVGGTPAYMAPEAWDGERCVESDLWAAGVILYELLAGTRPFHATSLDEFREVVRSAEAPELPDFVPHAVRGAVAKALEKRTEQRFRSAEEMAAALTGRPAPPRAADEEWPLPENPLLADQLRRLLRELKGVSPRERARAVRELGRLGPGAVPALCGACGDPSPLVRDAVVKALRELLGAGGNRGRQLRAEAAKALRALGTPEAAHCLEELGIG